MSNHSTRIDGAFSEALDHNQHPTTRVDLIDSAFELASELGYDVPVKQASNFLSLRKGLMRLIAEVGLTSQVWIDSRSKKV